MEYLPLFFDLRDRPCVVVGTGATAVRKSELLLRAGARVRVVTEAPDDGVHALARDARVTLRAGALRDADLEGCTVAVIALDDAAEAARAAAMAARHTVAVNAVDRPELCSCIVPALVDRSPVVVAISTAGAAPVLGRLLRARLEALLHPRLGVLARAARALRPEVARRLDPAARRRFWEGVFAGSSPERLLDARDDDLEAVLRARLDDAAVPGAGALYAVAAPADADPENLTLRGLRLLQQADLVVHDAALPRAVLDLVRRDAERRVEDASRPAAAIAEDLVALAARGQRVAWFSAAVPAASGALRDAAARAGVECAQAR